MEARGGIEPPIKVLQTFALPLGDRASVGKLFYQMIPRIVLYREHEGQKSEGGDVPPPSKLPGSIRLTGWLERELQTDLDGAVIARADKRVSGNDVGSANRTAKTRR